MRSFDPAAADGAEVPDPYHGSPAEFAGPPSTWCWRPRGA